jgi:hypothetical protein
VAVRSKQIHSSLKELALNTAKVAFETAVGQLYIDAGHDYKDTVFLAGSGRGGTTWIAELINFDNSYRLIFEPIRVPLFKPFHGRRYLRPDDDNPIFLDPMRIIVDGRLRHALSDRYNRQPFPRKRLVKEIVANLWLRWLHSHFPEIPLILLLRHPCAVVSSRLRLGWNYNLRTFLGQESLMADFLSPFRVDMEKATTPFEVHLFHWCIETFVPLRQFKPGQVHLAFYEDFCVQPQLEIARLFAFLGKPLDERAIKMVGRPSTQTWRRKSELPLRAALIDGWREHFSNQELRTVRDLLQRFGLDSLYREDGMPDAVAALKLFAG